MAKNEHRNDYKLFLVTRLSTTAQQLVDNIGDACLQGEFCQRFEMLLYDGIKGRVFRWRTAQSHDVWDMLKEISPPHLIRDIMELQTVKSELGRTRAWIRLTINESSLPNYLILISDSTLLSKYYNASTILLDTKLMEVVKEGVLLVTSNAIKVLFNPDSFDFEVAPSAISLTPFQKPASRTVSVRNEFEEVKIAGLTSNTQIPGTSQLTSSSNSSINRSSNNSLRANCSNLTSQGHLSDISEDDCPVAVPTKEYTSLLASPETLWIISPNSSDISVENNSSVPLAQSQLVEGDPTQVYQDYQNLETLHSSESQKILDKLSELDNNKSLAKHHSDTEYNTDLASKDCGNPEQTEVVPLLINISAEHGSPDLSPPITAQDPEIVSATKKCSSEPNVTMSENTGIANLRQARSSDTCSDNIQSDKVVRKCHTNPALNNFNSLVANDFNSLAANDVNSSRNTENSLPDILTDIDLEKSKNSLAEEQPLPSIPDDIRTGQVFHSLNESNISRGSLSSTPEVLSGSRVIDLTVDKERRSNPMSDVRLMRKRPRGNSLLRDSLSDHDEDENGIDTGQDMIPDTPLSLSGTKHLKSLYPENIFLLDSQQSKGTHVKDDADHGFDEECSARSAESDRSAVSNSSIYSSNSGDNILLLANNSVKEEEEEEEVFEETQSIPVHSSTPQDTEPLSSSLYKLFSRSVPKPNTVDTSKLSELNSAVSDDIPLSPELPVSPSCKRGYMSHLSGAGQITVNAGVATYESAATWLSLSKDMLWWLQKRVISQHDHCQCSPPVSPDITKSCSTSSSLLELCTEQCPCCNAIVIDYNKPHKIDNDLRLSRSCPPFSGGVTRDLELFKSSMKTRNTLSDDSANYFNLDILHNPAPTVQQIREAIEEEKRLLQLAITDEEKKTHVDILVKLRLKVQTLEEKRREENSTEELIVMGHIFTSTTRPSGYCDKCSGPIYQRLSSAVTCSACHVLVHKACLSEIKRNCALQNTADLNLITEICPDHGLNEQGYNCWDCQINIGYTKSKVHQCDYNGRYYCTSCHKKTIAPVPARILQNWDFKPRSLSAQSIDILTYLNHKETINLEQLNPYLFTMVPTLNQIRTIREDFILYRAYFIQCESAMKARLLLKLQSRQHFVESSKLYTIRDLIDLNSGILLKEVQDIHHVFSKHHQECERCTKHRFSCIVCHSVPLVDPFNKEDFSAASCQYCHGVYHRACFNSLECCQYCNCSLVTS